VKALVAGAGIGGLAAGIALREAGCEVEIFERARELREIGAGLMIWPNGTRSLRALGVEPRALTVRRITFCNWHGRRLMEAPVDLISQRYGSDVAVVHRAHLQAALADRFGDSGLRLGADVTRFVQDADQVQVELRDGTIASGDLLVGADGLRSVVRRQVLEDGDPVYLGSTIWRGMVNSKGIDLAAGHGLEKIKTIGDAYMAVAGAPEPHPDHAEAAADMALAIIEELEDARWPSGDPILWRVGIASGPVVAGVIGQRKFAYDLWGDTVNLASRLQSHGQPGRILVSESAVAHLEARYEFGPRLVVELKGNGPTQARFLLSRERLESRSIPRSTA